MWIDLLGVRIYYEQLGDQGPNVLFLHGWMCSVALWKPIVERLSPHMRTIALDLPGHGQSGRPPEPWGATEYAAFVAAFIEALNLAPCDIVGHSHGGRTALRLALDRPDLVNHLVLTGSAGLRSESTPAQKRRHQTFRALRSSCNVLDKLRVFGPLPERGREALRKRFGSSDYNALDAEMRKTFVRVVNTNLGPELPKISKPTLLLWGDHDTETPLWMGKQMERDIPDAGLVLLEGGSHYAYLEQPDRFCRIVQQFLLPGGAPCPS